jgi:GNAT superfamily N-acetyltransferase
MEDLDAALETMQAYSRNQIGAVEDSADSLKNYWQSPGFELSTDTLAIFTPEGQIVGYTEFWDRGEPHVRLIGWSLVHPDYWGRGLGKYLLDWSVGRAQQNLEKAPEGVQVVLQHPVLSSNEAAARIFTDNGFQLARSNYTMRIEFDQPPLQPAIPEGITIRAINGEEELRGALQASHESFKDHYGNTNQPFEEYYTRMMHHIAHDPHYDPSLWFIALDGERANGANDNSVDTIAGVSLCYKHMEEDPDLAWVGTLVVRRPWRKRGIGQALLEHSFCEFYRRGKLRVGLGVDASSLTGAVRLYERAGMHVLRKYDLYELEIRPGKEIMKRSVEEPSKIEEK